jgi:heat shock protein HslJ
MDPVTRTGRHRPRQLGRLLFTTLALVAVVAACTGAAATPAPSLGPIELNGSSWRLLSYLSPTGTSFTVPSSVSPSATFKDGQFSGQTGCNTVTAPYTQDGTKIAIGPLTSTKVACDEPMNTVEAAYLQALSVVDTAAGTDTRLILKKSDGFTALEFVKAN